MGDIYDSQTYKQQRFAIAAALWSSAWQCASCTAGWGQLWFQTSTLQIHPCRFDVDFCLSRLNLGLKWALLSCAWYFLLRMRDHADDRQWG
jgi:hypothetical protein